MAKIEIGDARLSSSSRRAAGASSGSPITAVAGSILAFYPGDFTPVCTRQFCSYRDGADRLDELDADVLGISPQSVTSHERFAAEHHLTVPLLADTEHATARAYGVVAPGGLVRRSIFIVDPDGVVRYRHVALLGLRYRDVERLGEALESARRDGRGEPRAVAVRAADRRPPARGEASGEGEGPPIALLHGLTATRRYVVHGSRTLARAGLRTIAYDARGHGESDPAPADGGYAYDELAADLGAAARRAVAGSGRCVLAGHSMGAHTLDGVRARRARPRRGDRRHRADLARRRGRRRRACATGTRSPTASKRGGVDGFIAAYDHDLDPEWRETILRITRERLERHRHPDAVAQALREVPRLAAVRRPRRARVPRRARARRRQPRRGRSRAIPTRSAEAWADALPQATLVSEEPGASPLAWQGGRLSRAIARFLRGARGARAPQRLGRSRSR